MLLKKTNKRAPTNGFDSTTIDDRLKNFSRFKTEGDQRHVEREKLVMTILIQKFAHPPSGKTAEMKQICQWAMREHISKLL